MPYKLTDEIKKCLDLVQSLTSLERTERSELYRTWRLQGTLPPTTFPYFLNIIKSYFDTGGYLDDSLVSQLAQELNTLYDDPLTRPDVQFLFSQYDREQDDRIYILTILESWLVYAQGSPLQQLAPEHMVTFARFLSTANPSCIVHDCPALAPTYQAKNLGPYFTLTHLKSVCLPSLCKAATREFLEFRPFVESLIMKLESASEFTPEVCDAIRDMYEQCWSKFSDRYPNYTSSDHSVGPPSLITLLVILAQCLSGARAVPPNYYLLLMPTIQRGPVVTGTEALDYPNPLDFILRFPLSQLLVSDDRKELISLLDSYRVHLLNPRNYDLCVRGYAYRPFTASEIIGIQYADTRFPPYAKCQTSYVDESLMRSTVLLIYDVLPASFSKGMDDTLDTVYLMLCATLDTLDSGELQRLYAQRITWEGSTYSILELLEQIAQGEEGFRKKQEDGSFVNDDRSTGCVTSCAEYFLQFVLNYLPSVAISPSVEAVVGSTQLQMMRNASERKCFSDPPDTSEIRTDKICKLLISLMTYEFDVSTSKSRLTCDLFLELDSLKLKNRVPSALKDVFEQLMAQLRESPVPDAYAHIASTILEPLLCTFNEQGTHHQMKDLAPDHQGWLRLISSPHFFMQQELCNPKQLFCVLQGYLGPQLKENHVRLIRSLMDDIIKILLSEKMGQPMQRVLIGVRFSDFLDKLSCITTSNYLLETLREGGFESNVVFLRCLSVYLLNPVPMQPNWIPLSLFGSGTSTTVTYHSGLSDITENTTIRSVIQRVNLIRSSQQQELVPLSYLLRRWGMWPGPRSPEPTTVSPTTWFVAPLLVSPNNY